MIFQIHYFIVRMEEGRERKEGKLRGSREREEVEQVAI